MAVPSSMVQSNIQLSWFYCEFPMGKRFGILAHEVRMQSDWEPGCILTLVVRVGQAHIYFLPDLNIPWENSFFFSTPPPKCLTLGIVYINRNTSNCFCRCLTVTVYSIMVVDLTGHIINSFLEKEAEVISDAKKFLRQTWQMSII